MRELAARIGLYRVSALLVACALGLEVIRVQVGADNTAATIAFTLGEVLFIALAAGVFVIARRARR